MGWFLGCFHPTPILKIEQLEVLAWLTSNFQVRGIFTQRTFI